MSILLLSTIIPDNQISNIENKFGKSVSQLKTAFITTAANGYLKLKNRLLSTKEKFKIYPAFVQKLYEPTKQVFSNMELIDFEIDRDINYEDFDVIFVNGGNVFYLIEAIQKYNFDVIIQEFLENKLYIGGSAGAVCLQPDVWPFRHLDDSSVVDNPARKGLSIINFNTIPHWQYEKYATKLHRVDQEFKEIGKDIVYLENDAGYFK